eukprot:gene1340-1683_t
MRWLQHLPASHLTKLTFGYDIKHRAERRAAGLALARLTALQELDISSRSMELSKYDIAAVAQLTNLQKLKLPSLALFRPLSPEWLPPQLQELHLSGFGRWQDDPSELDNEQDDGQGDDGCMQLGQLTALTRLQLSERCTIDELLLWHGDVLPPNLVVLDAQLGSLEPVLQVQHLQQLKLVLPGEKNVDLLQLRQLQNLNDLGLDYVSNGASMDESLWSLLPVKQLAFGSCDEATLQALAELRDLTSLQLGGVYDNCPFDLPLWAGYDNLARILQQLTALQELWWKDIKASDDDLWWHGEPDSGGDSEDHSEGDGDDSDHSSEEMRGGLDPASVLLRAIADHPLRSLRMIGMPPPGYKKTPILLLKAATGLTRLELYRCGVTYMS